MRSLNSRHISNNKLRFLKVNLFNIKNNQYYSNILVYPDHHERHWLLFLEFNKNKQRNLYFYGYYFIHRLSTWFVIVWMNAFTFSQCVLLITMNFMMLVYTFRVYNSCLHNFVHCFNWIVLLAASWMLPLFISSSDANKLKICGYVRII